MEASTYALKPRRMYSRGVSIPLKKRANLALSGWIGYYENELKIYQPLRIKNSLFIDIRDIT